MQEYFFFHSCKKINNRKNCKVTYLKDRHKKMQLIINNHNYLTQLKKKYAYLKIMSIYFILQCISRIFSYFETKLLRSFKENCST